MQTWSLENSWSRLLREKLAERIEEEKKAEALLAFRNDQTGEYKKDKSVLKRRKRTK